MLRRAPFRTVEDLGQVEQRARAGAGPVVVIFDADNTIVPQHADPVEFTEQVNRLIDRFEALPAVERVIILTNGPARNVERMISRGNKPFTTRRRLGLAGSETAVWVVGDQILTDGLLAWRLGGEFFHRVIDRTAEQRSQALIRMLGAFLGPLFLRRARAV